MLAMSMMLGGLPVFDITLSSNRAQWQRSVDAPQIPSGIPVSLILRVSSAIEIQSTLTNIGAIHIDELANGSQFHLINAGYALGRGGQGASGGSAGIAGSNGGGGGPAIRLDFDGFAQITNSAGRIWGGGGGGASGGGCRVWNPGDSAYDLHNGGGGGGGGAGGGAAGSGGTGSSGGTAGTTGSAGAGGAGGNGAEVPTGDGGAGGAYAVDGSASTPGARHDGPSDGSLANGASGGSAGYAVLHNSGTTVVFVSGSSSPNVKGTVGV